MSTAEKLDILDPEWINEEPSGQVVVSDEASATLAMRVIESREREIERIRQTADGEKARIENWARAEVERHQKAISFFVAPLESFLRDINEKTGGKTKSIKYPYGTIQLRKLPDKIEIAEEFKPEEHPDDPYVKAKTNYSVDKTAIKAAMKDSGELPEYATLVPGQTKFDYKVELISK